MLNLGYMESATGDGVVARVYYDATFSPVGPTQPLINGPRGYCLDVTNTSGRTVTVSYSNDGGVTWSTTQVAQGDPATSSCLTVKQLNRAGYTTRGDVNLVVQ